MSASLRPWGTLNAFVRVMNKRPSPKRLATPVFPSQIVPGALNRRDALLLLGSTITVVAGCGDSNAAAKTDASGGMGDGGVTPWARGGTASLPATFKDPFTNALGSTCSLTCKSGIGPCYASTLERRDISEGYPGLPLRLAFLLLDESCKPIPAVSIDIWHARNTGLYSGTDNGTDFPGLPPGSGSIAPGIPVLTSEQLVAACNRGDSDAVSHNYFRGVQTTDARGRATFDTCFPGWYDGRTVHIHYILRLGGQKYVTSQLYFSDEMIADVFNNHPDYVDYGPNTTTNQTDGVYQGVEQQLEIRREADGTMLAYKTLIVRSSLTEDVCGTEGLNTKMM